MKVICNSYIQVIKEGKCMYQAKFNRKRQTQVPIQIWNLRQSWELVAWTWPTKHFGWGHHLSFAQAEVQKCSLLQPQLQAVAEEGGQSFASLAFLAAYMCMTSVCVNVECVCMLWTCTVCIYSVCRERVWCGPTYCLCWLCPLLFWPHPPLAHGPGRLVTKKYGPLPKKRFPKHGPR